MSNPDVRRSRLVYGALVVAAVALGLASRRYADAFPFAAGIRLYAGDALWAGMVYFLAAAVWNRTSVSRLAIGSLAFCCVVEASQLVRHPWIDAARATRIGGLTLGYGFLWSDIASYTVGVAVAALVDVLVRDRLGARSLRQERSGDIVS